MRAGIISPDKKVYIPRVETVPISELETPESFRKSELPLFHEAGHATMILSSGIEIVAYRIGNASMWVKDGVKLSKRQRLLLSIEIEDNEGVIIRDKRGDEHTEKMIAAAGVAGELVRFNHIESPASHQISDRERGHFTDIWELQALADEIADLFDYNLRNIYVGVVSRMVNGKGFEGIVVPS